MKKSEARLLMDIQAKTSLSQEEVCSFIQYKVILGERLSKEMAIVKAMYELLKKERGI